MNQAKADASDDLFTTETAGLPEVLGPDVTRLADGDRLDLRIGPVRKNIDGAELRMLAYNGSIPGPILHVDQGSEITVQVTNDGDVEATVHWHGLRLENQYDGVPDETQVPIPIGGTYTCKVRFPDAGFYWYHPHIREDFGLEMGLYGTIVVEPADPSYWPAADRELTLTLDDLLVEDGHIAPFSRSGPTFVAMGRYGNVMLINGETRFSGAGGSGRGRAPVCGQHREHADLQLRHPRRPRQAGRRRQRPVRTRDDHRRGTARAVGARGHRRAVRHPRAGAAGAPHPRSRLRPRRVHRHRRRARRGRRVVRDAAHRPRAHRRASGDRPRRRTGAGQGARVLLA